MKAPEILKAGQDILVGRAKEYDPNAKEERNMAQIVRVFNAFYPEAKMTEAQGWHFMAILKTVRGNGAPEFHNDSAIDGVNYMALMGEALAIEKGIKGDGSGPTKSETFFRYTTTHGLSFEFDDQGDLRPTARFPLGLCILGTNIENDISEAIKPSFISALRGLIEYSGGLNPRAATRAERALERLTNITRA